MRPIQSSQRISSTYIALVASLLMAGAPMGVIKGAEVHDLVAYSFTTGNQPFGDGVLTELLMGQSVAGSFVYDSDVPATLILAGPPSAGATLYAGSLSNIEGAVAGNTFSDPSGGVVVGDNKYNGIEDILSLSSDPIFGQADPPADYNFAGFEIAGYTLVNVRIFWMQSMAGSDFL